MDAYNVCVVEDDQEIRDGIGIYLVSQGYRVFKAANGQEGLDIPYTVRPTAPRGWSLPGSCPSLWPLWM